MAKRIEIVQFQVTGSGEFPFDMLRYDSCSPKNEPDSRLMAETDPVKPRTVTLKRRLLKDENGWKPTEGRWKSFGWYVVDGSLTVVI